MNVDEMRAYLGRALDLLDVGGMCGAIAGLHEIIPASTLLVHTKYWSIAFGRKPKIYAAALQGGITMASTRYAFGDGFIESDYNTVNGMESSIVGSEFAEAINSKLGDSVYCLPATGDPRVHLHPFKRNGQSYLPLSTGAGGLQVFKLLLPGGVSLPQPDPQIHEGYEWMYVLRGRLRVVLGERDFELKQGEIDTRTPHWFGPATTESVEFLTLFGPQGERMHVRAAPYFYS